MKHTSSPHPRRHAGIIRDNGSVIDEKCVIYLKGKGFCWCPSDSWGLVDHDVCKLCQIKNSQIVKKIGPINPERPKVLSVTSNRSSS